MASSPPEEAWAISRTLDHQQPALETWKLEKRVEEPEAETKPSESARRWRRALARRHRQFGPDVYRPDATGPLAGSNFVFTVSSAILSPMSWPMTVEKR